MSARGRGRSIGPAYVRAFGVTALNPSAFRMRNGRHRTTPAGNPAGAVSEVTRATLRRTHSPQSARSSFTLARFQSISANPVNPSDQGRYINGLIRESPFMYS